MKIESWVKRSSDLQGISSSEHASNARRVKPGRQRSRAKCSVEGLERRLLLSSETLLKDINTITDGSFPYSFATIGNTLYFSANDGTHGSELWKSDGTANGTAMVKDIVPGSGSSSPGPMVPAGSNLYFVTSAGNLSISDGTGAGTAQLGTVKADLTNAFGMADGRLLFRGTGATGGSELWISDGTPAGTAMLKDINPGSAGASPINFVQFGSFVYFQADDGTHGLEHWRTDGTAAGTTLVADINPGTGSSSNYPAVVMNSKLYFAAQDVAHGFGLWSSDGTGPGTQFVAALPPQSRYNNFIAASNNCIYVQVNDATHGNEYWVSDGTATGTGLLKDVTPGTGDSNGLTRPFAMGGATYFFNGNQMWQTDGTGAGTMQVTAVPSTVRAYQVCDNFVYFNEGTDNQAFVYRSDGTANGTTAFSHLPNVSGILNEPFAVNNHTIYFSGQTEAHQGFELLRVDPGASTPTLVKEIDTNAPLGSYPASFIQAGNQVFFLAYDQFTTANTYQIWCTDGTTSGTHFVLDSGTLFTVGPAPVLSGGALNNNLLFYHNQQLWISDGTPQGTHSLRDFPGALSYELSGFVQMGGLTYFSANDANDVDLGLWVTDGTPGGTQRVTTHHPATLTAAGGLLYFEESTNTGADQLWQSDGTDAGTREVQSIFPSSGKFFQSHLVPVGSTLYFLASDTSTSQPDIWKTDGTVAGTVKVTDSSMGLSGIDHLAAVGNTLFFTATTSASGTEVYETDGTSGGTKLVKDIAPGPNSSAPTLLTAASNQLFFLSNGQVWRSDGTSDGTYALTDGLAYFPRSINVFTIPLLKAVGNEVFFPADDRRGNELYRSDGTPGGTGIVGDISLPGSSFDTDVFTSLQFLAFGNSLLFAATDHIHGVELWKADAVPELTADAGGPYYVTEGQTLTVSAAGSRAAGAPIVSYEWDFNFNSDDGSFPVNATGLTADISGFDGPSTQYVALRVTDADGNQHIDIANVHISNLPPTLSVSGPAQISYGAPNYTLQLASSDPATDTISKWTIWWGDGSNQVVAWSPSSVPHTYPSVAARYQISATATDEDGTYNTAGLQIGLLDPSFGSGGTHADENFSAGRQLAAQGDGKIVTVGGVTDFQLARFNSDGSLDSQFGAGGHVISDLTGGTEYANALAIQPDGKILVGGNLVGASRVDWIVARYDDTGVLDPTFGSGGVTIVQVGVGAESDLASLVLQPDGKILLGGTADQAAGAGGQNFCAARLTSNGNLDSAFAAGIVAADFGAQDAGHALVLQADGKIVIVGTTYSTPFTRVALVRFTASGLIDSGYGTNGALISGLPNLGSTQAFCAALQADGKIVVGGGGRSSSNSTDCLAVTRVTVSGSIDNTFGNMAGGGGGVWTTLDGFSGDVTSLALDAAGGIVFLGTSYPFEIGRLLPQGMADLNFGNGNSIVTGLEAIPVSGISITRLIVPSAGEVVMCGSGPARTVIARVGGITPSASITLANFPPSNLSIGNGMTVSEGTTVNLNPTFINIEPNDPIAYLWKITSSNGQKIADITTPSAGFVAADNGSYSVSLTITDSANGSASASATVTSTNVSPTATFTGSTIVIGSPGTVSFSSVVDPSSIDTATGFKYSFDFDNNGSFEVTGASKSSATVPATYLTTGGLHTVRGRVTDKNGGFTDYTADINVTVPPATVSGMAYADSNGNDIPDTGEPPITGITVYLDTNGNGLRDPQEQNAVTDANGRYLLSQIPAFTVGSIRPDLPPGWRWMGDMAGESITIELGAGADISDWDLSLQGPPVPKLGGPYSVAEGSSVSLSGAASSEVGGTIAKYAWDTNYNGTTFVARATGVSTSFSAVGLDGPSSRTIALRVTDGNGATAIATGSVTINNAPPTAAFTGGGAVTLGAAGSVSFSAPSDPSPADVTAGFKYSCDFNNDGTFETSNSTTASASVPASYLTTTGSHTIHGRIIDKDGGFTDYTTTIQVNAAGSGASISGTVYNDANGNGVKDSGEVVVSGQKLYIDKNINGVLDTGEPIFTTSTAGTYTFSGLAAGTYRVRETIMSGWRWTNPSSGYLNVTVTAGQVVTAKNFGETTKALISGIIFNDANANAKQDTGEAALSGWVIYLDTNNNGKLDTGELSVTTASDGKFSFVVPAGTYHLREVLKSGFTVTTPSGGLYTLTLSSGQAASGKNFGMK